MATYSVFKLHKWFLHQSGVEFNQTVEDRKVKNCKKDAHIAEIYYDPLVAQSDTLLYCPVLDCTVPVVGGHGMGLAGLQATGLRPPGFGREVSVLQ